jgi:hypothetical protein
MKATEMPQSFSTAQIPTPFQHGLLEDEDLGKENPHFQSGLLVSNLALSPGKTHQFQRIGCVSSGQT